MRALQERRLRTEIPLSPRRGEQRFQRPTPFHLSSIALSAVAMSTWREVVAAHEDPYACGNVTMPWSDWHITAVKRAER